jgi:hypothetical protein
MAEFAPHISRIALRLFRTPCNSVPSERSFSIQNIIHDKKRNRLLPEKTNKLMYIYMNRRVLDRRQGQIVRWEQLNEEQLLELEDELLADGAMERLQGLADEGLEELP